MKKSCDLRKTLLALLSTLCLVFLSFTASFLGVFSAKAEVVEPTQNEFYMLDGAEVNMYSGCGMRFTTMISKEYYDTLKNEAGDNGSLTFATDIGPLGFTPATDVYTKELEFVNGYATFYGVINYGNLSSSQAKECAKVDLTAKAYVIINYENDTESKKIYANRKDTTRSMGVVATLALLAEDYGDDQDAKTALERYVGKVTREEEVQPLTNRDTVVTFEKPVSGRVYLDAVKTDLFVSKATEIDIAGHINWDKVNVSDGITVSVFGNNGTSSYAVVSKDTTYNLELVYKDEYGNLKSDYRILSSVGNNSYIPARYMVEIFERVTGVPGIVQYNEGADKENSFLKSATLDGNYICIGVNNTFFKNVGLEYDRQEMLNGGYVIATKGNCVFLYGGDETVNYREGDGNGTAVFRFAEDYFNFVVTGVLPDAVSNKIDEMDKPETFPDQKYNIDTLSFNHDDLATTLKEGESIKIEGGKFDKYIPDINRRTASYGTFSSDEEPIIRAFALNGTQSQDFLSVYSIIYEDYLTIAKADPSIGIANRRWKGSCGHVQFSSTTPTVCKESSCEAENPTFTDTTATFDGYKDASVYVCYDCAKLTVSFTAPTTCVANYNTCVKGEEKHSCAGKKFETAKSEIWHNANYHFPIMNNLKDHPDWFGDDMVYKCNECNQTHEWHQYYYKTIDEKVKAVYPGDDQDEQIKQNREALAEELLKETDDPSLFIRENRPCTETAGCTGQIVKEYAITNNPYACDTCFYDGYTNANKGKACTQKYDGVECAGKVIINPSVKESDNRAKVSLGDDIPNKMQPCFNAHGNTAEYRLMVAESAKKFINNLKYVDHTKTGKLKDFGSITVMDGTTHCECGYCVTEFIKYGTMSGSVIQFTNDVTALLDAWMSVDKDYVISWLNPAYGDTLTEDSNEIKFWWNKYDSNGNLIENALNVNTIEEYTRPITINIFAYTTKSVDTATTRDRPAPVKLENGKYVAIDDSVKMRVGTNFSTGVYLVTSADVLKNIPKPDGSGNYTYDEIYAGGDGILQAIYNGTDSIYKQINNSDNESTAARDHMTKWGDLSGGTKMYLWINTQDSKHTTFPYYSANLMDADMLSFLNGIGAESVYFYAGDAESKAVTAYGNLKAYVNAKQMWETGDHLEDYKAKEDYLNELMNKWFDNTFIHENVITEMRSAFTLTAQMSARAVYLKSNYTKHKDFVEDENYSIYSVGNSDDYSNIAGMYGEYWDIGNLIKLYDHYKKAFDLLKEEYKQYITYNTETGEWGCANLDDRTARIKYAKFCRIKGMIDSEWYSPLMMITRYYLNDPAVIANRAEYVAKFEQVIKDTGIYYNGEYKSPSVPSTDVVARSTHVEPVIYDFTGNEIDDANALASKNTVHTALEREVYEVDGKQYFRFVKDIDGDGTKETIYDEATGELKLFPGEMYRVLLRVTEDIKDSSGKTIYSAGDHVVSDSDFYGYTKGMSINNTGRYSDRWPTYFGLTRGASIIYQNDEKSGNSFHCSSSAAFMSQEWRKTNFIPGAKDEHIINTEDIAGGMRNVAYLCDELNLCYSLCASVPVLQRSVYTIHVSIYSAIQS